MLRPCTRMRAVAAAEREGGRGRRLRGRTAAAGRSSGGWSQRRRRGPDPAAARDRRRRMQIETELELGKGVEGLGEAARHAPPRHQRQGPRLSRLPSATVNTGRRATSARCWGAGRNAGAAAYACFAERAVLQLCMFRNARMDRGVSFGMPCRRDRAIQPRCNLGLPMHRFCASWRSLLLIGCVTHTSDTRDPGGRDPAGSPGGGGAGDSSEGTRRGRGRALKPTDVQCGHASGHAGEWEGCSVEGRNQAERVNERCDRRLKIRSSNWSS